MRLIDANELLDNIRPEDEKLPLIAALMKDIKKIVSERVEACATIDPESLRPQGEWVNWGKSGTPTYENYGTCSVCHEDAEIHTEHRNYCPNCGAKMKGGTA